MDFAALFLALGPVGFGFIAGVVGVAWVVWRARQRARVLAEADEDLASTPEARLIGRLVTCGRDSVVTTPGDAHGLALRREVLGSLADALSLDAAAPDHPAAVRVLRAMESRGAAGAPDGVLVLAVQGLVGFLTEDVVGGTGLSDLPTEDRFFRAVEAFFASAILLGAAEGFIAVDPKRAVEVGLKAKDLSAAGSLAWNRAHGSGSAGRRSLQVATYQRALLARFRAVKWE